MFATITPQGHGLGWIPDLPDARDKIFVPPTLPRVTAPVERVDLRDQCPSVYNQGRLGSCTANALAAAFDFDRRKEHHNFMMPSRLFIYWNARDLEGSVDRDVGSAIRDGVKVLLKDGTPPETDWPYDITKFAIKPPDHAYQDAEKNLALTYQRILTPHNDPTHDMLACLCMGYPFVSGISIYESFESSEATRTGMIPMPDPSERLLGGHAVLVVGFEAKKQVFICRNSWGTDWGDQGYFYLPFGYLTHKGLANDMWLIQTVEV